MIGLHVRCSGILYFYLFLVLLRWLHVHEHLLVDHIGCGECGRGLAVQKRVGDHHGAIGGVSYSRGRDVRGHLRNGGVQYISNCNP